MSKNKTHFCQTINPPRTNQRAFFVTDFVRTKDQKTCVAQITTRVLQNCSSFLFACSNHSSSPPARPTRNLDRIMTSSPQLCFPLGYPFHKQIKADPEPQVGHPSQPAHNPWTLVEPDVTVIDDDGAVDAESDLPNVCRHHGSTPFGCNTCDGLARYRQRRRAIHEAAAHAAAHAAAAFGS